MVSKDKSPHRSSIRTRLNLLVIGAVTLSTLPAAGLIAGDAIERQAQARWTTATGVADLLAANAADAAQAHNAGQAYAILRGATQIPGIAYARLDLPNGQMLAEAGAGNRLANGTALRADATHADIGALAFQHAVRVTAPVRQGELDLGQVTIVQSSGDFTQQLLRALAGIFVLSGCALAGALYLARRMQNAMTCPIGELTWSMDAVTNRGDLSHRVETHSRDEIGALVGSYNRMLEALARRQAGGEETVATPVDIAIPEPQMPASDLPAEPEVEAPAPVSHDLEEPEDFPALVEAPAAEVAAPLQALAPAEPQPVREIARPHDIDVLDFVDDLVARFKAQAHAKGLELVTVADPEAARRVPADAEHLGEVVSALLSNALKFTETGHITIEIATDPKPDFWRLIVGDTGIGIDKPRLKSILKTEADPVAPGDDLRLPAARQMIEAMGGAMAVTSDATGSQFHIRLPSTSDAPRAAPPRADGRTVTLHIAAPAERDALAARFEAAGVTVVAQGHDADLVLADRAARDGLGVPADRLVLLVEPGDDGEAWVAEGRAWAALARPLRYTDIDALVELLARDDGASASQAQAPAEDSEARVLVAVGDDADREQVLDTLDRFGIAAEIAWSGRIAIERATSDAFDLVLIDEALPDMDGFEAAAEIRLREAAQRTTDMGLARRPIIALTAADATAWQDAGMDGALAKPVAADDLIRVLETWLSQAPAAPVDDTVELELDPEPLPAEEVLLDPVVVRPLFERRGHGEGLGAPLDLYRKQGPEALAGIVAAFRTRDTDALANAARTLKSLSAYIGARSVAQAAGQVEQAARGGRAVTIDEVALIHARLERTLSALAELGQATPADEPRYSPTPVVA